MYNITLVCAVHKWSGKCNSIELLKIIEGISPEIIFEELSYTNFDKSYKDKILTTLETDAIKLYLQSHNIEHIPVDTYPVPDSFEDECDRMYNKIFNTNRPESCHLRNAWDNQFTLARLHGFNYLNSDQNDQQLEETYILKEKVLNAINDENLLRIARLEKEVIEKREGEIIRNVYNYSKEHKYHQALLLIGSGHRKSIIQKIQNAEGKEGLKLRWSFYGHSRS